MYSVLIQNQKTIQLFQEYYPLFLQLFSNNQVGCCRWIESGRTIDTALPGLEELVGDKKEWRAIIIRVVERDENDMKKLSFNPHNPYDFYCNASKDASKVHESKVPLVRLTQILGEVPSPEVTFHSDVIQERNKSPRRIYVPEGVDKKEQDTYRDLVRMYEYDGRKPREIILYTFYSVRMGNDRKSTKNAWHPDGEVDGFEFAKRNRYSRNCRFVKYEYVKEGANRKEADLFNFWNSVMLLASEDIDPSSFQAYRLYNARVEFNMEDLSDTLQRKLDELIGCTNYVEESMRRDVELKMGEKHPKPEYETTVSAEVRIPKDTSVTVDTEVFHICPTAASSEGRKWESLRSIAEDTLESIFRKQDRVLDESANRMRAVSKIPEEMVTPMDKYEKLDMEAELDDTFDEILKTQNTISDSRNITGEKLSSLSDDVKDYIKGRVPRPLAWGVLAVVVLMVILSVLPAFIIPQKLDDRNLGGMMAAFAFCALTLGLVELIVLISQKKTLLDKIEKYNYAMEDNLAVLSQDMMFYSKFVSNIVNFSRGRSILDTLKHKKFELETEYDLLQVHNEQIGIFRGKVEKWAKAFYVPISFERNLGKEFAVDVDVKPRDNRLYTFDYNKEYSIPFNYTGERVKSPFSFIGRFIIEREEIFNDAGRDD